MGYRWSSHAAYLGERQARWLTTTLVLSSFGTDLNTHARLVFDSFVSDAYGGEVERGLLDGSPEDARLLGGDSFQARVLGCNSSTVRATIDDVIGECCTRYGITEEELASPSRSRRNAAIRAEIAYPEKNRASGAGGTPFWQSGVGAFERNRSLRCRSASTRTPCAASRTNGRSDLCGRSGT